MVLRQSREAGLRGGAVSIGAPLGLAEYAVLAAAHRPIDARPMDSEMRRPAREASELMRQFAGIARRERLQQPQQVLEIRVDAQRSNCKPFREPHLVAGPR